MNKEKLSIWIVVTLFGTALACSLTTTQLAAFASQQEDQDEGDEGTEPQGDEGTEPQGDEGTEPQVGGTTLTPTPPLTPEASVGPQVQSETVEVSGTAVDQLAQEMESQIAEIQAQNPSADRFKWECTISAPPLRLTCKATWEIPPTPTLAPN